MSQTCGTYYAWSTCGQSATFGCDCTGCCKDGPSTPPPPSPPPAPKLPPYTPPPPSPPPATTRSVALGVGYCRDASGGSSAWQINSNCLDSVQECGQAAEATANCACFAYASHDTLPIGSKLDGCKAAGSGRCVLYIGLAVATQASGNVGYVAHRLDPAPPLPPLPPPPTPSSQPPTPAAVVSLVLVAAGSVDDFGLVRRTELRTHLATAAGVAVQKVSLSVEAASVRLRFSVSVEVAASTALAAALEAAFPSADAASALLGVAVLTTPLLTLEEQPPQLHRDPTPPSLNESASHVESGGGEDSSLVLLLAGAGALLAVLILVVAAVIFRRAKR